MVRIQQKCILLNEHDLYVSAINSSYPCVLYEVEPGKRTEDGDIVAAGLSQKQYEELSQHIKDELHIILDKYELAKPKTAFHSCDSIVGIFFTTALQMRRKFTTKLPHGRWLAMSWIS